MKLKSASAIFIFTIFSVFATMANLLRQSSILLEKQTTEMAAVGESVRLAQNIKSRLLAHNRYSLLYSIHKREDILAKQMAQSLGATRLLSEMRPLINHPDEEAAFTFVERQIEAYLDKRRQLYFSNFSPIEQYLLASGNVEDAIAAINGLIEINNSQMNEFIGLIENRSKMDDRAAILFLSFIAIILIFVVGCVIFLAVRPLEKIKKAILAYEAGITPSLTDMKGFREIQEINKNFITMAERLEIKRQEQLHVIAAIAHDLRNPLNKMSIAAGLLQKSEEEKKGEWHQMIFRQIQNLDHLVGDLLDTAQIESGHLELNLTNLDVTSIVKEVVQLQSNGSDRHQFALEFGVTPIYCIGDSRRLFQVVYNLISNAIKYSPSGGQIKVKTSIERDYFKICIEDEGVGIDPADISLIFKPFNRSKATKNKIPGVGLGLSASRRIVEAHNGSLSVTSRPGKGSTFSVTLPLSPTAAPANPTSSCTPSIFV